MSYILDALKRADAERERGAVPGLHSQTAAPKHWFWGQFLRYRRQLAEVAAGSLVANLLAVKSLAENSNRVKTNRHQQIYALITRN